MSGETSHIEKQLTARSVIQVPSEVCTAAHCYPLFRLLPLLSSVIRLTSHELFARLTVKFGQTCPRLMLPELTTVPSGQAEDAHPFTQLSPDKPTSTTQHDSLSLPQPISSSVSRVRLYMMVLADFGLAFVWLCKFAVATYVKHKQSLKQFPISQLTSSFTPSPYFRHSLKAGPFLSHLVWIMGPLSGLIVAPVVGILSDRCTSSFGRRRPFMLAGAIGCIVSMNVFSNAAALTFGFLPAARLLAVMAFGVLDFSTNAIMFPSRALLGDLLPPDQQHSVQSAAAVVASLAEICAGAYVSTWKDPVTHISRLFIVASFFLAVTCAVSLYVCRETPISECPVAPVQEIEMLSMEEAHSSSMRRHIVMKRDGAEVDDAPHLEIDPSHLEQGGAVEIPERPGEKEEEEEEQEEEEDDAAVEDRLSIQPPNPPSPDTNPSPSHRSEPTLSSSPLAWREMITTIKTTLLNFPRPLIKVGIVYALAWFLWFASLPYYSQWLGLDVLNGNPDAEPGSPESLLYQRGVTVFAIANAVKALLAMAFGAFYPQIIKWVGTIGERVVFGTSFFVFSFVLFLFAYTDNVWVAAGIIALGSVPFIATQTIPIALVVQRYPRNLASNLGVMNLFCVIPQLVDTLYTGKIAEIASEAAVLRVASGWGFAAALAAFCFL